jgi:hypothetical protein
MSKQERRELIDRWAADAPEAPSALSLATSGGWPEVAG